jgi:hypothetical protein
MASLLDSSFFSLGLVLPIGVVIYSLVVGLEETPLILLYLSISFDEFAMPSPAHLAMIRAISQGYKRAEIFATCPVAADEEEGSYSSYLALSRSTWLAVCDDEESLSTRGSRLPDVKFYCANSPSQERRGNQEYAAEHE